MPLILFKTLVRVLLGSGETEGERGICTHDCSFGRHGVFFPAMLACFCVSLGSAFPTSYGAFLVVRLLAGFFAGGVALVAYVLAVEFLGADWRGFGSTMSMNFFAISELFLAGIAYSLPNWRHLMTAFSFVSVPFLLSYRYVRESPRWLLAKGRAAEARGILRKIAQTNQTHFPSDVELAAPQAPRRAEILCLSSSRARVCAHSFASCHLVG
eukprot:m.245220 g.245220  ORF g.245220 m.245220 type:complete len:212 (-) comp10957_c0_seq4:1041-1676(-)